ncbi:hypothetical protein NIES4103_07080 [Nostoc sp. NIES-4103]|nr:hypothetical protein NIES4103_07080 [Nostoc sp. NIES-4103]
MVNGQWSIVNSQLSVVSCEELLTIDYRLVTNTILDFVASTLAHSHQSSAILLLLQLPLNAIA